MKSLKIGNIRLKNRLFLAPMVDVTDLPYRLLCRRAGAGIGYTEMINIGAIMNENVKTKNMMRTNSLDRPVGIQITGRNVKEFEKVCREKESEMRKFNLVDINCGCPSSRIVGNESGSYLLRDPVKIGKMVRVLKDNGYITTAKIRLGFRKNEVVKIVREIEKAGADLITIHARLSNEKSSVEPKWKEIAKVKRNCGIPIVGNGGIVDGRSCEEMLDIADGAMIAGAAIGNPLVFKQLTYYLRTGKELEINYKQKIKEYEKYINLCERYKLVDINRIKWLGGKFLSGFNGASRVRNELMKQKSIDGIIHSIEGNR